MGAYTLVTKPSAKTEVWVKWANGTITRQRVSVYHFAYKPSYSWEGYNRQMEFKHVWPCRNAFDRSKTTPEEFGMWDSDWKKGTTAEIGACVFRTRSHVSLCDESIGGYYPAVGTTIAEPQYVEEFDTSKMWAKPLDQLEILFS